MFPCRFLVIVNSRRVDEVYNLLPGKQIAVFETCRMLWRMQLYPTDSD